MDGVTLIVGSRGAGKTALLQELERTYREAGGASVVWDRMGHWTRAPGRTVVRGHDAQEAARVAIEQAPATLFLDELTVAWPPRRQLDPQSALGEILYCGRQPKPAGQWRRRGPVALVAAAQRPMRVSTDVRGLLNVLIVGWFPHSALEDLEWIADAAGADVARAAAELPEPQRGEPARFLRVRM